MTIIALLNGKWNKTRFCRRCRLARREDYAEKKLKKFLSILDGSDIMLAIPSKIT